MSDKNICIIEDNEDIRSVMKEYLEGNSYQVYDFGSAEEFYAKRSPDFKGLYLVDWHLPGEPGVNIVSHIRDKDKISPIFIVSAFSKNTDVITGLKAGADDYITKPFNFDELLARIENAYAKYDHVSERTEIDGIKLLAKANSFLKDGETVSLTEREFKIFQKLFEEKNKPVSREELIECFRNDDTMTVRNIDVHVFSLRKKIKEVALIIETVRGIGYKLT